MLGSLTHFFSSLGFYFVSEILKVQPWLYIFSYHFSGCYMFFLLMLPLNPYWKVTKVSDNKSTGSIPKCKKMDLKKITIKYLTEAILLLYKILIGVLL